MTYRTDGTDEIDYVESSICGSSPQRGSKNESLFVLTCYRTYDSRFFDRLRDLPYGVGLLVLAAKWSPQAFLGG